MRLEMLTWNVREIRTHEMKQLGPWKWICKKKTSVRTWILRSTRIINWESTSQRENHKYIGEISEYSFSLLQSRGGVGGTQNKKTGEWTTGPGATIRAEHSVGGKGLGVQCKPDLLLARGLDSRHHLVYLIIYILSDIVYLIYRLHKAWTVYDGTFTTSGALLWNTLRGRLIPWPNVCLWAFLFLKSQPMDAQGTYRDSKLTSKSYKISNMYWQPNASHALARIFIITFSSNIENKFKIAPPPNLKNSILKTVRYPVVESRITIFVKLKDD